MKHKEQEEEKMVRYAEQKDKEFWFSLDKHLTEQEFQRKVRDKMAYVLVEEDMPGYEQPMEMFMAKAL